MKTIFFIMIILIFPLSNLYGQEADDSDFYEGEDGAADDSDFNNFDSITRYMVNEIKQLNSTEIQNYPFLELSDEDIREILMFLDVGNLTKVLNNISNNVLIEIHNRITPDEFNRIILKLNQTMIDEINTRLN